MIRAWVILDTDMIAAVESPSYTRLRIYDITTTVIICEISETNNEVPPPVPQPGKNRHGQRRISPSLCGFRSCGRNVGFKGIRLVRSTLHCIYQIIMIPHLHTLMSWSSPPSDLTTCKIGSQTCHQLEFNATILLCTRKLSVKAKNFY